MSEQKVVPITTPLQPVKPAAVPAHSERPSLDTGKFEQMWTMAERMANMTVVPLSLRTHIGADGKRHPLELGQIVANCAKVVNQAADWNMNPFALLDCAAIITDQDGEQHMIYEAKVIMAALEAKGVILHYDLQGSGPLMTVKASGPRPDGSTGEIKGSVQAWQTSKWRPEMYDKMLIYRSAREWARLYKPSVMLGIYAADDFEAPAGRSKAVSSVTASIPARMTAEPTSLPPRRAAGDVPAREAPGSEAPESGTKLPSGDANNVSQAANVSRETDQPRETRRRKPRADGKPTPVKGRTPRPAPNVDEDRIWLEGFRKELADVSGRAHLERVIERRQKAISKHLSDAGREEANRLITAALKEHPDQ